MSKTAADLQKAAYKALASHFGKAAAHHEQIAATHEKMAEAHKAHAEHHDSMGKSITDAHGEHHKASAAFHKTMHGHHSSLHKAHSQHAAHMKAMAEAHSEPDEDDTSNKVAKFLALAGEQMSNTPTNQPAAPAVTTAQTTPAAPAAPVAKAEVTGGIESVLEKSLNDKLTEAINTGLDRVLNSPEFSKAIENRLANKMLEKLGNQPNPADIQTFPVARPGENTKTIAMSNTNPTVNTGNVPAEFADMVKFE